MDSSLYDILKKSEFLNGFIVVILGPIGLLSLGRALHWSVFALLMGAEILNWIFVDDFQIWIILRTIYGCASIIYAVLAVRSFNSKLKSVVSTILFRA
jgi:hypothetical protein